ncbi:MAG: DUF1653 domain-containing protein [Alphaproteobacteria bacterium]|nr:DUF1653 domain-containing protein [Alphaproteobacteria bacterium]OJV15765.1 MAG: TonB box-like protein [Alphaproteobacteria bacterium 33-17]
MKLGIYEHYSGKKYRVLGLARHTETLEEMVVYHSLYGDYGIWVRPKAMFEETVEINNQVQSRFTFLSEVFNCAPEFS